MTKRVGGNGLLVHEWVEAAGGSEKVVEAMLGVFPQLDFFCLWADASPAWMLEANTSQSWIARTPLRESKAAALPFMLGTWRAMPRKYDWALISSHLFAHHAFFGKNAAKLVYAHTPARYIWAPDEDHRGRGRLVRIGSAVLKPIDRHRAREITSLSANSEFVRDRIAQTWKREAEVIYPPVESATIANFRAEEAMSEDELQMLDALPPVFLLGASRAVPYKRLDLVIRYAASASVPSVIVGAGPELDNLKALARDLGSSTYFLGKVSDAVLYSLYQRCLAFVFPPIEDFGIMPVEAMAAGAPVIGNIRGGVAESVVHGQTGFLTDFESEEEFVDLVREVTPVMRSAAAERALLFDRSVFDARIESWVEASL